MQAGVNGRHQSWLVDTGALRSVCGSRVARILRLRPSGQVARLVGVGSKKAWLSQPVNINWKGRKCRSQIYVVDSDAFPSLLGLSELSALDVMIRPKTRDVHVCNVRPETASSELVDSPQINVASGVDESLSDEELMKVQGSKLEARVNPHLTDDERKQIMDLFFKYQKCWLRPRSGQVKVEAEFEVSGRPFKDKIRPLTRPMIDELNTQLDSLLANNVIRPSKSPWGSVPVFSKKKDGGWRLALDYRQVNKQMKSDGYPIPLVWDNLQKVAGHKYYTVLDGMWGFWNIPLAEQSKEVTAFLTHRGSFEFNVLPFGTKNSPGEFQRAMDRIFSDLYYKGVLVYIDDIVIYADTLEEHNRLLEEVLQRASEAGLQRCVFSSIFVLGHSRDPYVWQIFSINSSIQHVKRQHELHRSPFI